MLVTVSLYVVYRRDFNQKLGLLCARLADGWTIYDSNSAPTIRTCFDIWRATNADYLLTYFI